MANHLPAAYRQAMEPLRTRPRFRGVTHEWAFFVSIGLGVALIIGAEGARATVSAAVFAATVAAMFGASALYHRVLWTSARRRRAFAKLDHAAVFLLIAGTYTPFGLLVLSGAWRWTILAIVWTGAAAAITLKLVWGSAPKWVPATIGIVLGWVGVVAFPQLVRVGVAGLALLLAGGVCYTLGAIIYARRRPDPLPGAFGYHEIFHLLVVFAAAFQYAAIAFFVLPRAG
jgi:hemolysin III